jgi:predicted house-cleaning NTP pyrophosphatase (Maf/HAM1 superfamily)
MLGGVLVTGAFIFTDKRSVLDQNRSAQLDVTAAHTVLSPDNDLYKDISRKMQTISDEEISRYLDENTTTDALDWQPEELN